MSWPLCTPLLLPALARLSKHFVCLSVCWQALRHSRVARGRSDCSARLFLPNVPWPRQRCVELVVSQGQDSGRPHSRPMHPAELQTGDQGTGRPLPSATGLMLPLLVEHLANETTRDAQRLASSRPPYGHSLLPSPQHVLATIHSAAVPRRSPPQRLSGKQLESRASDQVPSNSRVLWQSEAIPPPAIHPAHLSTACRR